MKFWKKQKNKKQKAKKSNEKVVQEEKCHENKVLLTPHSWDITPRNETNFKPKLDIVPHNTMFEGNSDKLIALILKIKLKHVSNHS